MKPVGFYKDGSIGRCSACTEETTFLYDADDILPASEYVEQEWICPNCNKIADFIAHTSVLQFTCPDCKKTNLQVREPNSIIHEGDQKYEIFTNSELICQHCESSFEPGLMMNEDRMPAQFLLFRIEKNE